MPLFHMYVCARVASVHYIVSQSRQGIGLTRFLAFVWNKVGGYVGFATAHRPSRVLYSDTADGVVGRKSKQGMTGLHALRESVVCLE